MNINLANDCGKRWYVEGCGLLGHGKQCGRRRGGAVCWVCTEMVSWSACLSFHVEGWEKRRCLASDAAIRARVE